MTSSSNNTKFVTSIIGFVASLFAFMASQTRKLCQKLHQAFNPKRVSIGFFALGLPVALVATQCQNAEEAGVPISLTPGEFAAEVIPVSLNTYRSCNNLLDYIHSEVIDFVGPYGFDFRRRATRSSDDTRNSGDLEEQTSALREFSASETTAPFSPEESADLDFSGAADSPAFAAPALSLPNADIVPRDDFSSTNVQVAGVDEADIVKTNGRLIVGLSEEGRTFWVVDVSSETPELVSRIGLSDGSYQEMYLTDDKAILIGTSSVGITPFDSSGTADQLSSSRASRSSDDEPAVVITEIDLRDPTDPDIKRHLRIEGAYVSSRVADGYARVVVSTTPTTDFGFINPGDRSERSEQIAERLNRQLVQESTERQWLPEYSLNDDNGRLLASGVLLDCNKVHAPEVFSGFNQISVLSFAVDQDLRVRDAASVMARGETVYASADNIYVSHVIDDFSSFDRRVDGLTEETVIHKFALRANGRANYEGSGAVVGKPLNQFAFHENDGRLFVATTLFEGSFSGRESFVTSLEDRGNELVIIDKVGDLGRGERIFAVRYIGSKAYIVTFRQTDPLYVVDLSDPANLTTEGELKITGYSAYLHPVGEDLLLGVGQEATDSGWITGTKFSLFDVSDPSNPRVVNSIDLDGGSSNVEWDHRAFLWWAPESLAVVPINNHNTGFYGALALRVESVGNSYAIVLDDRITHNPEVGLGGNKHGCEWYQLPAGLARSESIAKICPAGVLDNLGSNAPSIGEPDSYQCTRDWFFEELFDLAQSSGGLETTSNSNQLRSPAELWGDLRELVSDYVILSELGGANLNLSEFLMEHIVLCQPERSNDQPSITRSMVIGDDLWTVSAELLQANDLDSLDRRAWVRLPS